MNALQHFPPRSHSRAEGNYSASITLRDRGDSNGASSNNPTLVASVTSTAVSNNQLPSGSSASSLKATPQKTQVRTYDSRLITRELDRIAMQHTPQPPAGTQPLVHAHNILSTPGSSSTLGLAPHSHSSSSAIQGTTSPIPLSSTENPWMSLHVLVLPLFNAEPLKFTIEDLNALVRAHIRLVVSRSPSKALATMENEVNELVATGMITLNANLNGLEDERLVARVVELWVFFWERVLPYVEGILMPIQTDQLLLSLHRTPKPVRSASPSRTLSDQAPPTLASTPIDIRRIVLRSFRESIIMGAWERLHNFLASPLFRDVDRAKYQPRFQQMLLVLLSIQSHSDSLSHPNPPLSPGEHAVVHLLQAIRNPHVGRPNPLHPYSGARSRPRSMGPTGFTIGAPRDRRGRIAEKPAIFFEDDGYDGSIHEEDTPTVGGHMENIQRLREREFLDSLKSPEIPGEEGEEGRYNVTYEDDSDDQGGSDEEDYGNEIARTGLSMSDWDHR